MTSVSVRLAFGWPFASSWRFGRNSIESDSTAGRLRLCLALVYFLTFSDFALKSIPVDYGVILRYLPEVVLFAFAAFIFLMRRNETTFPLARPLVVFAIALAATTIATSSPALAAVSDFRSYFRFALFAYIVWGERLRREHIHTLIDGILGLAVLELLIAAIEIALGAPARRFFAPELHWARGDSNISDVPVDGVGWISGTFANYNHFGMFMVMACIVALSSYVNLRSRKYLIVGIACGLAVLLSYSRHSLLCLVVSLLVLMALRRKILLAMGTVVGAAALLYIVTATGAVGNGHDISLGQRLGSALTPGALSGDPSENVRLYLLVALPPRFLSTAPLLGEGPGAKTALSDIAGIDAPESQGFTAAQGIPKWVMNFVADVVWVMLLGLYGVSGLAAFAYVIGTIAYRARRLLAAAVTSDEVRLAEISLTLLPVYVLTGFFSLTIVARDTIPLFWLVVGAMLSLSSAASRRRQVPLRNSQPRRVAIRVIGSVRFFEPCS